MIFKDENILFPKSLQNPYPSLDPDSKMPPPLQKIGQILSNHWGRGGRMVQSKQCGYSFSYLGCSPSYSSTAALAIFSSFSSSAISSSLGVGRARAVTSITSRVATRVSGLCGGSQRWLSLPRSKVENTMEQVVCHPHASHPAATTAPKCSQGFPD
jgi:hypothetical protein